ncbi:hypothetical protein R6Q59_001730 [Mikania micrantha]
MTQGLFGKPLSPPSATILAGSHHPPTTTAVTILADNHRSKFILPICGTNFEFLVESNKFVEALRTVPLAYPELCTQLFEGSTYNGFESWGPSSTLPHPFEEVLDNTSNGLEDVDLTAMGTPTVSVNDDSPVQPKKGGEKKGQGIRKFKSNRN